MILTLVTGVFKVINIFILFITYGDTFFPSTNSYDELCYDSNLLLSVAFQVVNIFNLFITYGDTFLPSPSSYDELYYEIVRMHQVFENLYSMGKSYNLFF